MHLYENFSKNRLFKNVEISTLHELLEGISYKKSIYKKNDVIALEGDRVTGQYIMLSGLVRGEMNNYVGKIIKIEDIKGSQLLAPAFLFGPDNRYPVDIIASKETECIFIVKSDFSRLLQMDLTVQNNFLNIVSGKAQFLSNKIKFLSLQPIKGKIASYLLKRTRNSLLNTIDLPYSQDNLADLFGVTRPALTRALRELDQDKIICAKGKRICVHDEKRLLKYVQ
jgi:CRP-like cAMP-binding protein